MPRPTRREFNVKYVEVRQESNLLRERNDCAVVAVSIATGAPYAEVLRLMTECGRRPGRGTAMGITECVLDKLGFKMVRVDNRYFLDRYPSPHHNIRHMTSNQPDRFNKIWADGHTYLMRTRAHILAIVNGQNMDWTRGRAQRCWALYRVVRKTETVPVDSFGQINRPERITHVA